MEPLDLAQKIKVLGERRMRLPIVRTASEPYDPELPTKFDKTITTEIIDVTQVNHALLGIIKTLCKIIMTTSTRHTKETWKVLRDCQALLKESKRSIIRS